MVDYHGSQRAVGAKMGRLMRRRDVLAGGALAAGASSYPAPALTQGNRRLTMVTDWPEGPGLLQSSRRLARAITEASQGHIEIEVFSSGALVRPFETFDAVQAGVADMFHSHIGYFDDKSPAFHFFSAVPFGLTATELLAWLRFGGGQALWDELAGGFGIKPLLCSSTGMQMGGWFVNEINSVEAFRGLRYRMAEPGAEVYRRLGAIVVVLPGSEIVTALRSGAIEACEWLGPWLDTAMGLHEAARYYYYPGWHEPGTALALGVSRGTWEGLDDGERRLIEAVATSEYALSLAEFTTNNALALRRLREEGRVAVRPFSAAILKALSLISSDVVASLGSHDDLSGRIYQSFVEFRTSIRGWSSVAEAPYLGFVDSR